MKKVIVFGTFDFLHIGHLHALMQAKQLGEYLTVVVARDARAARIKGKKPFHTEKERLTLIRHLDIVNEAMLGERKSVYAIIKKKKPDIIALGYDQRAFTNGLAEYLKKNRIHVSLVRLRPYKAKRIKSRKIKNRLMTIW